MEELKMEHSGKQITARPAMIAVEGKLSRPEEHRGLREAIAFSHQSGFVGRRVRVDSTLGNLGGGSEPLDKVDDTFTK
jgi:hypothetical protein